MSSILSRELLLISILHLFFRLLYLLKITLLTIFFPQNLAQAYRFHSLIIRIDQLAKHHLSLFLSSPWCISSAKDGRTGHVSLNVSERSQWSSYLPYRKCFSRPFLPSQRSSGEPPWYSKLSFFSNSLYGKLYIPVPRAAKSQSVCSSAWFHFVLDFRVDFVINFWQDIL